jgi:tetratricopeptide (TPR) repeat protein
MPGHPDPRVNLGICLDRAGRVSEAIESFEAALQVSPGYLPAIQGAALVAARLDRVDARLETWLDEIAARSALAFVGPPSARVAPLGPTSDPRRIARACSSRPVTRGGLAAQPAQFIEPFDSIASR